MLNEITIEMDNKLPSIDDSNSSEDYSRDEEKWTKKHNEFLQKLCDDSKSISIKHNIACKYKLYYYRALSTQTLILPIISAAINQYISDDLKYINTSFMVLSSGCSLVNTLYNFGKSSQQHNEYAGKYSDLCQEIEYTLCRSKKNRQACEVSMQKYIYKTQSLNSNAPML
jgi:hypothetical protein